jgi:hypothetical protein
MSRTFRVIVDPDQPNSQGEFDVAEERCGGITVSSAAALFYPAALTGSKADVTVQFHEEGRKVDVRDGPNELRDLVRENARTWTFDEFRAESLVVHYRFMSDGPECGSDGIPVTVFRFPSEVVVLGCGASRVSS